MNWKNVASVGAILTCGVLCAPPASAESASYDFKDPKGVNGAVFVLDSKLEPIVGIASSVTGMIQFDPQAPEKTTGHIAIQTETLHLTSSRMQEVLHSEDWMDVKQYPSIEFVFERATDIKILGDGVVELTAVGKFTCKGITKPMSALVKLTHLKGQLGERLRGQEGDLLVLRTTFEMSRKDYNIKPDVGPAAVADKIEVRVSIVGSHSTK